MNITKVTKPDGTELKYPTNISNVEGLSAELAKIITGMTISGGTITATKANGEKFSVNITATNVGLGNVNNTADKDKSVASAAKLTTARAIQTNLASTSSTNFDGSANVEPGVKGVLSLANGGTGQTTAAAVRNTLGLGNTTAALPVANGGTGQTNLSNVSVGSATKATQDESGNNIKSSYASSISISDHTITLKNKNGTSLGSVTVPDNNTTYSAGTGISLNGTKINCTVQNTDTTDLTKMTGTLPVTHGGTGQTNLSNVSVGSATKATQDESGNNIKSSYASSISISDHTITLKNKNGTSLGSVTVPDNNTTYPEATQSAQGLMSAADKKKLDGIAAGAQVNPSLGDLATINKSNDSSKYLNGNGKWTVPPNGIFSSLSNTNIDELKPGFYNIIDRISVGDRTLTFPNLINCSQPGTGGSGWQIISDCTDRNLFVRHKATSGWTGWKRIANAT